MTTNLIQRLRASFDVLTGRVPFGRATTHPFWWGMFTRGSTHYPVPQRSRATVEKLRRFSETPIPRRLINYLRNQISLLKWQLRPIEGAKLNREQKRNLRKLERLLRNPNPDAGWKQFIQQVIEELCVLGISPVEVKRLRAREVRQVDNEPSETADIVFWPFDGSSLNFYSDWKGDPNAPRYAQVKPDGEVVDFLNSELIPFKYTARVNTPFGLSPLEVAMTEIEYLLNAEAYAGRVASNVTPKKLLFFKGMSPEQLGEFRNYWHNEVEGSASIPSVSGEDAKSVELGLTDDNALFLRWQEFLIAVIADAFGVDIQKLNLVVGMNRSTADRLDDVTDEGSILPFADMLEEAINVNILRLFGLSDVAEFRFIYATAISDQKAVAVLNQVELQDDSITINQANERMGRPPLLHPITGEDIGKMTLSFYREACKIPEFRTKGLAGLEEAIERQREMDDAANEAKQNSDGFDNGENSNNTSLNPDERSGNGVYSAPKPKEKPANQRSDPSMETS